MLHFSRLRVGRSWHDQVIIDKCIKYKGLWFDNGEAEQLKGDWMADFADSGDPEVGKNGGHLKSRS